MKFTNKELTEALKAKFGKNLAMSERTMIETAEKIYANLESTGSEEELEATIESYLPIFESINGNVRRDKSEFVKEWEKSHPKPKPDEAKPTTNENNPQEDALNTLLKKFEAFERERELEKAKAAADAKKMEIRSALKTKGITDDKWLDAYLKKQTFSDDTDINNEVDEITALYNIGKASGGGNANVGIGGGSGQGEQADFSDVATVQKRKRGQSA